jgi:hypothetical protein
MSKSSCSFQHCLYYIPRFGALTDIGLVSRCTLIEITESPFAVTVQSWLFDAKEGPPNLENVLRRQLPRGGYKLLVHLRAIAAHEIF